ncbi:MAG: sulfite exporter TauE/SafE family protein [Anaerolineae bacterium]|nr:sulfite exporter TauE/SafE family protein [Anaerolineae bacterium]
MLSFLPTLTPTQWALAIAASVLIGVAKTGVPGVGILNITVIASVFGGRATAGITLPMLILADTFAVLWYRKHANLKKVADLTGWIFVGMALGVLCFILVDSNKSARDIIGTLIGILVLIMLGLHFARQRYGDQFSPTSGPARAFAGAAAGFATMISNAAGPIMSVYMSGLKMPKDEFMGTTAWYFFLLNVSKIPVYLILGAFMQPFFTRETLIFNLVMSPFIIAGVFLGRLIFKYIPQKWFVNIVLALAAFAAIRLIVG